LINQSAKHSDEALPAALEESVVIGGGNENWIVQSSLGTYKAKKAFSCLVCPEIGDKVLSVSLAAGGASILAILERKSSQATRLKFGGDVDFSSTGSIKMLANERLEVMSGDAMNFDTVELSMRSETSSVSFDRLSVTGNEANQYINKIRVMSKYLETVSETSKQVMKNSFRLVSGLESLTAGEVLQQVKKRFTVQSKQVSMLAEEDAKLNGKRVHLG
jgi:hypothetical protein